jgi:hypothetical protein
MYDLSIQCFGSLNALDKIMRQVGPNNDSIPYDTDLVFESSQNNLVKLFEANKIQFATGEDL